ncbi:glycoside hydrolase family 18 protein [Embleya scabrispora]|uniref:glycoside hydrolase family 18 protein n=1 Tax=Embleya scabrispora TaxID=159449 RepID=UPI00037D4DF9|nr:glycoside hydrolase family 18 protein [Embleya scabrispora]MYS85612.1 chitinase [Streptomyces sp. SID5474]
MSGSTSVRPHKRLRPLVAAAGTALLTAAMLTAAGGTADGADAAELVRNGDFESGLTGWTCSAGSGATVSTPAHAGTSALKATPAGSDNARCAQTVTVQPSSDYVISGWVRGSYVYLGATGTGTTDPSTWTGSAPDWTRLTTTFRTGANTTSVTLYTHGWYGTGAYYADDLSLTGPGGGTQVPAVPTGLTAGTPTTTSVPLSWTAVPGATGYNVYRNGTKVQSVSGTGANVTGLTANTAYDFQVSATNSAGESAKSAPVTATTTGGGTQIPATPTGLAAGTPTTTAVPLTWTAVPGATGYNVYRNGASAQAVTGPSATVTGLSPATAYSFQVSATNSAGESAKSAAVTATTATDGGGGQLPPHALVGYLHASFANGAGYTKMADVPASWDVINLSFGEPTSVTSGDIRFVRCPATECSGVESDADFKTAIRAKQAAGKKVLISIGGQNGQVQLSTTAARDKFVESVGRIIDEYGLDGLDIDFEGHSLSLNTGDTDFRNPTTPVIVNLISAVKTLKAKYGGRFVLTMAPETFFVQMGYQYYGSGQWGGQDPRCGAYLPVIHALRDDLTLLHVQDYNSGSIMGLDNQYHSMGGADFHIAMTDMLLTGFPVAGNTNNVFPALRPEQVAIGMPASVQAGNGWVSTTEVNKALDCLTKGTNCGGYTPHGVRPNLRGLMTWSINWDRFNNLEFSRNFDNYFGG